MLEVTPGALLEREAQLAVCHDPLGRAEVHSVADFTECGIMLSIPLRLGI